MRPFISRTGRSLTGALGLVAFGTLALLAVPSAAEEEPGATEAEEPEEQVTPPPRFASRIERDQHLLAQAFPDEARRLATSQGELLVLYKPALHAHPQGTVLMAHSADTPGDWPFVWENLRQTLPYYGWATLALTLPTPPAAEVPPRADTVSVKNGLENKGADGDIDEAGGEAGGAAGGAAVEDPVPEQAPQINLTRAQRIGIRLDAALAELPPEAQQNVVLLVDNVGAAEAVAHIQPQLALAEPGTVEGQSPLAGPVRALVVANLYPQQPLSNTQLRALFSEPALPLLDLFLGPEHGLNRRQRQLHRGLAQQQNLAHYQALLMPPVTTTDVDDQSSYWVRRLHTFMSHQNNAATLARSAFD